MSRRWLDPAFFSDEKLAKATIEERQLFAAMIANQDDDGRLLGHPGYLRSIAFPYDDFSIDEVRQMRDHLTEVNPNVIVYENSSDEYIQLRRHKRYQRPRYYHPSKFPAPLGWPFEEQQPASTPEGTTQLPDSNHEVTTELPSSISNHDATQPPNNNPKVITQSLDGNPGVSLQPPNSKGTSELPDSSHKGTEQYTEDRVGRGKGGVGLGKGKIKDKGIGIPTVSVAQGDGAGSKKVKTRLKPHQQEAGVFLDLVEKHEGVPLLSREKLISLVRTKLFGVPGTTPEKLLGFYCWLKETDHFFHNKAPPQIIGGMPDRYPSWLAGKLKPRAEGAAHERVKGSRPSSDFSSGKW